MTNWVLTPLGSLVARDGRPFGSESGNRMRLTPWLYPSVAAGSFRTMVGKNMAGRSDEIFTPAVVEWLKQIAIGGPLPYRDGELYFPRPQDIVFRDAADWLAIRPEDCLPGEGTDLPLKSLIPATISPAVTREFKAAKTPGWWSRSRMEAWLREKDPCSVGTDMEHPEVDLRTHVSIEDTSGAAEDKLLFQTSGYAFADDVQLAVRVSDADAGTPGVHPFGGERRLAAWERGETNAWSCPEELAKELRQEKQLRMVLATPAIFSDGWKPGWIGEDLRGTIPGTGIRVRLFAACVERWKPISGWSLERGNRGEKPVRRMVPAGSVYFFKKETSEEFRAEEAWLQAVSDADRETGDRQAAIDGFGLSLWGKWSGHEAFQGRQIGRQGENS